MRRAIACFTLFLAVAASATDLRAQWTSNPLGGPGNAGITFRPLPTMVTVTWKPLAAGAKYRLFRAPDSTSVGTDISGPITETTFTDKNVQVGTTYFYRVDGVSPGAPKSSVSARARFTLVKPVAVELPAKKKP